MVQETSSMVSETLSQHQRNTDCLYPLNSSTLAVVGHGAALVYDNVAAVL